MAMYIHDRVPEFRLAPDEHALRGETQASCDANIEQILRLLAVGAPATELTVPGPALDYAQGLVHRNTPLAILLRAYRLGHAHMSSVLQRELRNSIGDNSVVLSSVETCSNFIFEYIDGVCGELVDAYHVERDRWVRSAAAIRAETVRSILEGDGENEQSASARLGYDLRRWHIGLILAGEPTAVPSGRRRSLEREAIEAAALVGSGDPLLIPAGATSLWAWCGTFARPTAEALATIESHRPTEGVRLAVGRPAYGIEGFRVTHVEAGHASRFWEVGAARMGGTTAYRAVEVVSLLAADIDRARRFVASELGPLAEDSDSAARIRSTLLTFLAHGASHTRAAQALHMHHNTVYNRVRRAEELLGTSVNVGSLELQTALVLAETLGAEVLT
jgi:hypothetical protein